MTFSLRKCVCLSVSQISTFLILYFSLSVLSLCFRPRVCPSVLYKPGVYVCLYLCVLFLSLSEGLPSCLPLVFHILAILKTLTCLTSPRLLKIPLARRLRTENCQKKIFLNKLLILRATENILTLHVQCDCKKDRKKESKNLHPINVKNPFAILQKLLKKVKSACNDYTVSCPPHTTCQGNYPTMPRTNKSRRNATEMT